MAAVVKSGTPSPATKVPPDTNKLPPMPIGEDIGAGDACYLKSDGKIWRSNGSAAAPAATVNGYAPEAALVAQHQSLSLFRGVTFNYTTGGTPGAPVYLSPTVPGGLDSATNVNQPLILGFILSDGKRVRLNPTV